MIATTDEESRKHVSQTRTYKIKSGLRDFLVKDADTDSGKHLPPHLVK